MRVAALHRRLSAAVALCALIAFVSGAGFDAPLALPTALVLLLAVVWRPSARAQRWIEPGLRILALLLAARATMLALEGGQDVVAPMVDLLLLLLAAEALRDDVRIGAARLYTLSFALLIAASAYRPGLIFGIAFVAFIILLTLALTVGHIARQAQQQDARRIVLPARFLFVIAALSSVVLLTSAAVFVTFPRVTRSWVARGGPPVQSVVGFSDVVSLGEHGATIAANPEIVLRIEFPDGPPPNAASLHWRGRSYDRFDGVRWHRSAGAVPLPSPQRRNAARTLVRQLVYARPLETNVIFGLHPIVDVQPRSRIWPIREANGDLGYLGRATPVYLVSSVAEPPSPEELRAPLQSVRPPMLGTYTQLPPGSSRIGVLADSLTAGIATTYDRALRIEQWLQTEFRYTRELPRTVRETSLEYFLFQRRAGHCEYFSSAMVVMLRTLGIPARNVNGFLGGDWNAFGEYLAVSQNNAHSWVEVWLPGSSWVQFDPTPAAAGGLVATSDRPEWLAWVDGLEHRWNKWVLDYAIEDQIDLLQRVSDPFTRTDTGAATDGTIDWVRWGAFALLATALWAVLQALRGRGRTGATSPESRSYRRLRRAYARAAVGPAAATAPLAFADALTRRGAPGAAHAAAAVRLYVRGRFGHAPLTADERSSLQQHVAAAIALVRRRRNAWSRRAPAVRS